MSNLKQIGLGFIQYAQDYDERLPNNYYAFNTTGYINWDEAIFPYVKNVQVFQCPSAIGTGSGTTQYNQDPTGASLLGQWAGNPNRDYGMNGYLFPTGQNGNATGRGTVSGYLALASIPNTADVFLIGEARRSNLGGWYGSIIYATNVNGFTFGNDQANGVYNVHHLGGSNWLYVDGHVKWQKPDAYYGNWTSPKAAPWIPG